MSALSQIRELEPESDKEDIDENEMTDWSRVNLDRSVRFRGLKGNDFVKMLNEAFPRK